MGCRALATSMLAALAVALLWLSTAGPAAAAYEQVRSWDADYPQPIALDAQGNLVVGSNTPGNSHVTVYSPGGQLLSSWGSPEGFNTITGIAVDAQARIHVSDLDGIQVFDAQGKQLESAAVTIGGQAVAPYALDVDARGDLYLTHGEAGDASVGPGVLRFSASQQFLAGWDGAGAGPGQFGPAPLGIAADGRGGVYVADTQNDRIQRFSDGGAFLAQWGGSGAGPGQLSSPAGLAIDTAGNVFVADEGNGRVQVFNPGGGLIDTVPIVNGSVGPEGTDPRDVAVAADGTLYVTEAALFGRKIYAYRPLGAAPPSGGQPPAAPPPPSGPGRSPKLAIASKSLSFRKGKIAVAIECAATTACRGKVSLLKGRTVLGARRYKAKAGAEATVAVELSRGGLRLLARTMPRKLTVKLAPAKGAPVTRKLAVKGLASLDQRP